MCFQNYSDILGNNTKAVRNCKELYKDQNELWSIFRSYGELFLSLLQIPNEGKANGMKQGRIVNSQITLITTQSVS